MHPMKFAHAERGTPVRSAHAERGTQLRYFKGTPR